MTVTETTTIKLLLDARDLDAGVSKARARLMDFGGAAADVAARLDRMRAAQLDLKNAIEVASKATVVDKEMVFALRQELDATTQSLGRMTGATSTLIKEQEKVARSVGFSGAVMADSNEQTIDLSEGAAELRSELAPLAAAISNLSASLQTNGGVTGDVIGGIGQMATAFAIG